MGDSTLTRPRTSTRIGFAGLGTMGEAMALRLVSAGVPLTVWNRTPQRCGSLRDAGAAVAESPADLFAACDTVLLMLADAAAVDAVLGVGTTAFRQRVEEHLVVQMGTIGLDDSRRFAELIAEAGGTYVESPVSGSRKPAESGQLVAMVAGPPGSATTLEPLLRHCCRQVIDCGSVPNGLATKLVVNTVLITMVTGLAEAVHQARRLGVPLELLSQTLLAGPMANDVVRVKLPKLVSADWGVQAAIRNVHDNCRLVVEASRAAGADAPLMTVCEALYAQAIADGLGDDDMVAVLETFGGRP